VVIQIVRFESTLTESQVTRVAEERIEKFRALPGLIQKYYVKLGQPNHYGGIYIWDSMESLKAYRSSELAATIPEAYQIVGAPTLEVLEGLFQLRD